MKAVLADMGRAAKAAKAKMLERKPAAAPPVEQPEAPTGPTLAELEQALRAG